MNRARSVLYLPASNARAVEKARGLACDVAVLDLEDAVAPEMKAEARAAAGRAWACGSMGWTRPGAPTTWRRCGMRRSI
jgi:citrate lyase beta subunit